MDILFDCIFDDPGLDLAMAVNLDFSIINIDESFSNGEKASIRRVKVEDAEEVERLFAIETDPGVVRFVEGLQSTKEELIIFGKGDAEKLTVAVSGKEGFVKVGEEGKLQGWICFYPDDEERLERLKVAGIGIDDLSVRLVKEISYAKYPGAPRGQMSSGLRQIIKILTKECINHEVRMVVVAYTDTINYDSKRLLEATGFVKVGEIEYHSDSVAKDDVWTLEIN